jgi:hypothetical protein
MLTKYQRIELTAKIAEAMRDERNYIAQKTPENDRARRETRAALDEYIRRLSHA